MSTACASTPSPRALNRLSRQPAVDPNQYGGRENPGGCRPAAAQHGPTARHGARHLAEESTSWPAVSRPTYVCGLASLQRTWDGARMLQYMTQDPCIAGGITARSPLDAHAFTENFVLPSHTTNRPRQAVDARQMGRSVAEARGAARLTATVRPPGQKLMFMGAEIGQARGEPRREPRWHLLDEPLHLGLQRWVRDLITPISASARCTKSTSTGGFRWIDCNDNENSVVSCRLARIRTTSRSSSPIHAVPRPSTDRRAARLYRELLTASGDLRRQQHGPDGGVPTEPVGPGSSSRSS